MSQDQQDVIDYLPEENRALRKQLESERFRLNDAGRVKAYFEPSGTRLHWTDGTGDLGAVWVAFVLSALGYLGGNFGSFCGLSELGCLGANFGRGRLVCAFRIVFLLHLESNAPPLHVRPDLRR